TIRRQRRLPYDFVSRLSIPHHPLIDPQRFAHPYRRGSAKRIGRGLDLGERLAVVCNKKPLLCVLPTHENHLRDLKIVAGLRMDGEAGAKQEAKRHKCANNVLDSHVKQWPKYLEE